MKFLEDGEEVTTMEPFYDLFEGYINPDRMLEPEYATKVKEAVETLRTFLEEAERKGYLELI